MASSKNSKTEKQSKDGKTAETPSKSSKPRKHEDLEKKKKKQKKKDKEEQKKSLSNGNVKDNKALIVPSSSTESQDEEKEAREENNTDITNGTSTATKPKKGKRKQEHDEDEDENDGQVEDSNTPKIPMNRIRTILKGEDPDMRVSQEALFAINKATEKFLQQFTQDAHACSVQDRKKAIYYRHLSSVVSKQRRYDFLADFVPEKLRAEDALKERNSGGNGGG